MNVRKFDRNDALLSVAYAIETICAENNITNAEFARRVGTAPFNISTYMCLKSLPSVDLLMNISATFDVSIDWILGVKNTR